MAELEASTEQIEEQMRHHARSGWVSHVALGSALFAVLAAVAALLSNHHADEAMIEQIQAANSWSYYQAKGIKANLLQTKLDLLQSLGKPGSAEDEAKVKEYKKEQEEISDRAKESEAVSRTHLKHHGVLARSLTLFQIAIGIAAIAVLSHRKKYWWVSLAFSLVAAGFLVQGVFF